jgi:hypothetical protein
MTMSGRTTGSASRAPAMRKYVRRTASGVAPRWYVLSRAAAHFVKSGKRSSVAMPNSFQLPCQIRVGSTALSSTKRSVRFGNSVAYTEPRYVPYE